MSENENKVKSQIIEKTTEIMSEYGRYIGSAIVVLTLFVICGTTLVSRLADSKMPSGVMMTLPTVSEGKEPFSGDVFYVEGLSYQDMKTGNYVSDELENIEKSEREIQEILAAKQEERQKKAAQEAMNMEYQNTDNLVVYNPDSGSEPSSSGTTVPAGSSAQYTYADENGTYRSLGEFELTAYCPCPICCGIYSNMVNPTTASGTRATQGRTIATDTSVIPFGSQVVINGKIYTAEDTGGAIKGNRIDIYFESHTEALYFGRQKAQVYLVE